MELKPIGPDNGGDRLYLTTTVAPDLWDRVKFIVCLLCGSTLSFEIEIDTERMIGRSKPGDLDLHHVFKWAQKLRRIFRKDDGGVVYEAVEETDDQKVAREIREIDERNKRGWWRRWC